MVRVCFTCGAAQVEPTPGPKTVFVLGPGEAAAKLDAALRQRLLAWISKNPALGLDASLLTKEVPRVPFALVVGIDEASAAALVLALRGLGLEAEAVTGGRMSLAGIRAKGWILAKRVAAIGATGTFFAFRSSGAMMLVGGAVVLVSSIWRGYWQAARPVAKLKTSKPRAELPSTLEAALGRVAAVVPAMAAARHRDALRGVIERALSLREALDAAQLAELEPQLAQLRSPSRPSRPSRPWAPRVVSAVEVVRFSSAAITSVADCGRSVGDFARSHRITRRRPSGTVSSAGSGSLR